MSDSLVSPLHYKSFYLVQVSMREQVVGLLFKESHLIRCQPAPDLLVVQPAILILVVLLKVDPLLLCPVMISPSWTILIDFHVWIEGI